ncbi:hypothetical protein [Streptomyces sp. NPDC051546]|uniref:hypothetical protein n=1 Tax=Streptomyces sp. NPDC051546 TaxID=3365655 RepID=UPI0037BD783A
MTSQPTAASAADPRELTLDIQHTIPLLGPSTTEIWQVQLHAGGTPVGSLRAVLNVHRANGRAQSPYSHCFGDDLDEADDFLDTDEADGFPLLAEEQLNVLRSRLSAHGGFYALAADQLLGEDALGLREFGSLSMLVFDQLTLTAPWDDPTIAAAVIASVIDEAAVTDCLVVLPAGAAAEQPGAGLLAAAGPSLWAEQLSDDTQSLDTKFDEGEGIAEVRETLHARIGH